MDLPLRRLAGTQCKVDGETQIQEERGVPELLPARAETRLPSGKVTATKSGPSCAGTDPLKGLNGRQHQLSSQGERQRSRPAGRSAQRTIRCWRRGVWWEWQTSWRKRGRWRCGVSIPRGHHLKRYTDGISTVDVCWIEQSQSFVERVWLLCLRTRYYVTRALNTWFSGNLLFSFALVWVIILIHFAKLVEIHLTPFTWTGLDFSILKVQYRWYLNLTATCLLPNLVTIDKTIRVV